MDAIRKIEAALAAGPTEGPWEAADRGDYSDFDGNSRVILGDDMRLAVVQTDGRPETEANAEFIAATNPAAIREVLQTLAAKDAEVARLRAEMRRYLPVLDRLEDIPGVWNELTAGTGIATLNGYRHVLNPQPPKD